MNDSFEIITSIQYDLKAAAQVEAFKSGKKIYGYISPQYFILQTRPRSTIIGNRIGFSLRI